MIGFARFFMEHIFFFLCSFSIVSLIWPFFVLRKEGMHIRFLVSLICLLATLFGLFIFVINLDNAYVYKIHYNNVALIKKEKDSYRIIDFFPESTESVLLWKDSLRFINLQKEYGAYFDSEITLPYRNYSERSFVVEIEQPLKYFVGFSYLGTPKKLVEHLEWEDRLTEHSFEVAVKSIVSEFNHENREFLNSERFYNPYSMGSDGQQAEFKKFVLENLGPVVEVMGLEIATAQFL